MKSLSCFWLEEVVGFCGFYSESITAFLIIDYLSLSDFLI